MISTEIGVIVIFGLIFFGIFLGYPLALPLGFAAFLVGSAFLGVEKTFLLMYQRFFEILNNYVLAAVPLFVFMGAMIESSGIAEKMFNAMYLWLGRLKGGLAIISVLIGTILAACVGIIGASVTMLSLLALPAMVKRGYNKSLACGSVIAGGCLGILIPPSIMLVVLGPMIGVSVGKLFFAAFIPGFVLSASYSAYIGIRCLLQPETAPGVTEKEISVSFLKKTSMLITSVLPTVILIFSVLGVIFMGIAAPTEAAAVGAFTSIIIAIGYRRLNWQVLRESLIRTLKLTSMILLIAGMAYALVGVFMTIGGGGLVRQTVLAFPGGKWGVFSIIMLIVFLLGFMMDWIGIVFIVVPIIVPIIPALGFNPLWFSMMICINLQTSFMTPPLAPGIFYLKGSLTPELGVTMGDIIRGVIPFVICVLIVLVLCVIFPQIILWLPGQMIG